MDDTHKGDTTTTPEDGVPKKTATILAPTQSMLDEATELAESYRELQNKLNYFRKCIKEKHCYTKAEIYYLLTMGAHQEGDRVKTSGLPGDPTGNAVANVDAVLESMNRDIQKIFFIEVLEPYQQTRERVELFNTFLTLMDDPELRNIARQRYQEGKTVTVDSAGKDITAYLLKKAESRIIQELAIFLTKYKTSYH